MAKLISPVDPKYKLPERLEKTIKVLAEKMSVSGNLTYEVISPYQKILIKPNDHRDRIQSIRLPSDATDLHFAKVDSRGGNREGISMSFKYRGAEFDIMDYFPFGYD